MPIRGLWLRFFRGLRFLSMRTVGKGLQMACCYTEDLLCVNSRGILRQWPQSFAGEGHDGHNGADIRGHYVPADPQTET